MMRLLLLPLSLSAALRTQPEADRPVKRVYGPENRHCHVGTKEKETAGVIGGTVLEVNDHYPFLAWLGDDDGTGLAQFCGGSLIRPNVVLTAAHCLYEHDEPNSRIYVRFGLANFMKKSEGGSRRIINWRRHEKYNGGTVDNDLALIVLESNATLESESLESRDVQPVDISDGGETNQQTDAMITGWGSTDEECRNYDTKLREAKVTIGPKGPQCSVPGSKTLTSRHIDSRRQICAGIYTPGGMLYPGCGDSGGPLLIRNDLTKQHSKQANYTLVGMVSWSFGIPWPDVFTRVSYYKDWIDSTVEDMVADGLHPFLQKKGRATR